MHTLSKTLLCSFALSVFGFLFLLFRRQVSNHITLSGLVDDSDSVFAYSDADNSTSRLSISDSWCCFCAQSIAQYFDHFKLFGYFLSPQG